MTRFQVPKTLSFWSIRVLPEDKTQVIAVRCFVGVGILPARAFTFLFLPRLASIVQGVPVQPVDPIHRDKP